MKRNENEELTANDEAKKSLHEVTDKIHDLLNGAGADNGAFMRPAPPQGTVRMCFEMPKAWVLLGALVALSRRDDEGVLNVPQMEHLIDADNNLTRYAKRAAKRYFEGEFYYNGHEELHHVFHMMHPPFSKPKPSDSKPVPITQHANDEIPF